jgi:hypothetical protein
MPRYYDAGGVTRTGTRLFANAPVAELAGIAASPAPQLAVDEQRAAVAVADRELAHLHARQAGR